MGTRRCPGMAKPDSNFVYYVTKTGGRNKLCKCVSNMRHVTYERVQYLCKSTHVQEDGSIVNEYNILFYN
jgi:hypothetical protein